MLYPIESESREVRDLAGLWQFKVDRHDEGFDQRWYAAPLADTIEMPVPASYNDLTQDASIRDHIGWVWYERTFFTPAAWHDKRIVLRFGSATHAATAYVNGKRVAQHVGGYMPFEADVTEHLQIGQPNRVTVAVSNVLDWTTIPPGHVEHYNDPMHPQGDRAQHIFQDFFNYAGLHRPVRLVVTPRTWIQDITVVTDIAHGQGIVRYTIDVAGGSADVHVRLLDESGNQVAAGEGAVGELKVATPTLWEPGAAYLYELQVTAVGDEADVYRLPVGIRTVRVTNKQFLINEKPFYFKGFGKHEDADLRGKGHDDATNLKDFALLQWIGANSFRTSHYPYSEEIMRMADRWGIAVIDETAAVGLNLKPKEDTFKPDRISTASQQSLLRDTRELIQRDKNHPCVVMWSIANEAATDEPAAVDYFKPVFDEVRRLDPTRPVTIVTCYQPDSCLVTQFADVVCVNRYFAWYTDPGRLELVEHQLEHNMRGWHEKFNKPVIVTEYGADSVPGLHQDPSVMFTEEYQADMLHRFHNVFDRCDFMAGEHVWNFADFATRQEIRRVVGNKKGVFTRQRQPKLAAFVLQKRWRGSAASPGWFR